MRVVIQRVSKASVSTGGKVVGNIENGLFILLGIHAEDTSKEVEYLTQKIAKLRVMSDSEDKMNLTVKDKDAQILLVSQFTLYADTKGGNRPSFIQAARPEVAKPLYEMFVQSLRDQEIEVATGSFGNYMSLDLVLDGPVTIVIDTRENERQIPS
jgi:D-aminoacyl-tRNA deacylase